MAEHGDFEYLRSAINAGHVHGSVLELGSYRRQVKDGNTKDVIEAQGLVWEGTDIEAGPGVDFTLDLLDKESVASVERTWDSVLAFNLVEHLYDPVSALSNASALVAPGGTLLIVGPTIWELHDVPADYWRPMPDFLLEFARRNHFVVPNSGFKWIIGNSVDPSWRLLNVLTTVESGFPEQKIVPSRRHAEQVFGGRRWLRSRIVHRIFNTAGRELWFSGSLAQHSESL